MIDIPERLDHARRAGPQREEGIPSDSWSYQFATETPSSRDPAPAAYVRVRNAYSTPIMATAGWRSWNNAYDNHQVEIGALSVETGVQCSFVTCTRSETFDVRLTPAQLRSGDDAQVRLTSRSGEEKFLTVPTGLPRARSN